MLPTFQVRGLRHCSADTIPGAEEGWADVQLDNEFQYEQLTREHPETTLSYVDDDDGEIITVSGAYFMITPPIIAISVVAYTTLSPNLPPHPASFTFTRPKNSLSNSSTLIGRLLRRTFRARRGVTPTYASSLRPLHPPFRPETRVRTKIVE